MAGPLPVAERQPGGELRERGRLAPHQRRVLRFANGMAAVVSGLDARAAGFDAVLSSREAAYLSVKYQTL